MQRTLSFLICSVFTSQICFAQTTPLRENFVAASTMPNIRAALNILSRYYPKESIAKIEDFLKKQQVDLNASFAPILLQGRQIIEPQSKIQLEMVTAPLWHFKKGTKSWYFKKNEKLEQQYLSLLKFLIEDNTHPTAALFFPSAYADEQPDLEKFFTQHKRATVAMATMAVFSLGVAALIAGGAVVTGLTVLSAGELAFVGMITLIGLAVGAFTADGAIQTQTVTQKIKDLIEGKANLAVFCRDSKTYLRTDQTEVELSVESLSSKYHISNIFAEDLIGKFSQQFNMKCADKPQKEVSLKSWASEKWTHLTKTNWWSSKSSSNEQKSSSGAL